MTLTSNTSNERTEVFHGEEDAMRILLQAMANVKKEAVVCSDANSPAFSMGVEQVKKGYIEFKKRGIRIRQIVEITKGNIDYCKEFMNYVELRHMDNVKGNMAVSETEYVATTALEGAVPLTQTIYSNVKAFLEQQQYFFENLWNKAVPAEQRIKELEEGVEPEFVDVITDGGMAASIMVEFARSMKKSAKIILPNPRAMIRGEKLQIWKYLIEAANDYGAQVQVISPITKENAELARQIMDKAHGINILAGVPSAAGLFVQDEERYFRVEYKNIEASDYADAVSNIIYSNSASGVKWLKGLFDTLWKQSELHEKLRVANEKLIIQDRLQKEFINIAAHELRTPIQPILVISEMLEQEFAQGGECRITEEELRIIVRNAHRLERLSSDILEIARIESDNLHLNIQEFNLNDIILPLAQDAKSQIANKEIDVQYAPIHDIAVRGDKDRIAQVIWNLLNNAIKFTDKGVISIKARKEGGQAMAIVRDTGIGINPEVLPRLFSKFVTKSDKGTGLGLYISKSIIEAHGGKIWGENNKDGKGATFTFTLPLN